MPQYNQTIEQLEAEVSEERKRLSTDRLDISFGELINLYRNKELIIRPEYQRLYRWSTKQKTALIESILLSIPIPPIFVAEDKNGVWELIDGLQRVSTFISFFGELDTSVSEISYVVDENEDSDADDNNPKEIIGNKWILEEGGLIKGLQGFNIDTLPTSLRINLKRSVCRVEILRGASSNGMKYELFKRLNSGGSKLTPQEIRNAIYRGVNPRLNELMLKLSGGKIFEDLIGLSEAKKQELYDQELILRFIAFYNNSDSVNENTENYLNTFMENAVNNNNFDYDFFEKLFNDTLELIYSIGNNKIFRNSKNLFVPAEFEGITIAVAQNIHLYRNNKELLIEKINALKEDADFRKYSGTASNSKSRIKNRLRRANEIFKENHT